MEKEFLGKDKIMDEQKVKESMNCIENQKQKD